MKQVWSCEYCGEAYASSRLCSHHELDCSHNPKNRTCDTCSNWYWDPSSGMIGSDGEPEGGPLCKLIEFEPFSRNCDGWNRV